MLRRGGHAHLRRASGSTRRRADEPPRLILRFAVLSAVGLALAAAGLLLAVRQLTTAQAERAATGHARFVADSILNGELEPSDFAAPVAGVRRGELDSLFEKVLVDGALLVKLFDRGGTITYSSDHTLIGTSERANQRLDEVFSGRVVSDVASTELRAAGTGVEEKETLRAYVPIPFGRQEDTGAMALYQDYAPIAEAARQAFFPVAGILEVALVALFVMLFPVLRRVTHRIRRQVEEIEHLALHDDLTELPNRTLFRDRVEQALLTARRDRYEIAVILIDLDRFKEINDALGHPTGDRLLQDVSARLRAVIRENETFARLGGDEFAVLLPRSEDASVSGILARIRAGLDEPFVVQGLPLSVEASIGVSVYPDGGEDVEALIQHAEVAMYLAKEAGSGHVVYAPELDPTDPNRLAIVGELRGALERHELVLYFQPKVELGSGEIRGVEALLRWQHPDRGLLPPSEFVPQAERTGLIKPLTHYVVDAALEQSRAWREAGLDLHVAVNVTVPNLLDLDFASDVNELLVRWGVKPGSLELEITEGTLMADPFRARHLLEGLSDAGVRLAIDDFGTGYSSLSYLKRLPVNELKIDKSFVMNMVDDPSDATIVRSTIDLGKNLGLQVVAEGVETRETWRALAALGCDLAQGYLVGEPMPADELTARFAPGALNRKPPVARLVAL